jgi:hypothetical protein
MVRMNGAEPDASLIRSVLDQLPVDRPQTVVRAAIVAEQCHGRLIA